MRIGFIGAGRMGHGMVLGLLKGGYSVFVTAHRNRSAIDDLVTKGAVELPDPRAIANGTDCIILCLPNSQIVYATLEVIECVLRRGQILVDTGTSEPASTRKIAMRLKACGLVYVDAPLTGGPEQAARSELGVLCGASLEDFDAVSPILSCFASTIRHMGPVGTGHTAKLISNYLAIGMVALVSEAFATTNSADIDWRKLYEVMLNGSGNSGVLRKMVEPALYGDFDGYKFSLANAAKDMGYFQHLNKAHGNSPNLANAVEQIFLRVMQDGRGAQNVSQLLNLREPQSYRTDHDENST